MIEPIEPWPSGIEQKMSSYGEMYAGYYYIHKHIVFVGFVSVILEHRGKGHFKHLLSSELKRGMDGVVLLSPSFATRRLAERYGYVYHYPTNTMVWMRNWPCFNHQCKDCEGNICVWNKHYNDCPYRISEYIEFMEVG